MNDLTFTTKLEDIYEYGLNNNLKIDDTIDIYFNKGNAVIEWEVMVDARQWGIKDISSLIKKVNVSIPWEVVFEDDMPLSQEYIDKMINVMGGRKHPFKNLYEGVLEINSEDAFNGTKFELVNNLFFTEGSIYPDTCEVNFDDMTIEIS